MSERLPASAARQPPGPSNRSHVEVWAPEQGLIDIDMEPQEQVSSPILEVPKRDKGKWHQVYVEEDPAEASGFQEADNTQSNEWDDYKLEEARHRSLRQSLLDRVRGRQWGHDRHPQSSGAGPSRLRDAFDVFRDGEHASTSLLREDYSAQNSRHPANGSGITSRPATRGLTAGDHQQSDRDFYPAPNTRVAQYLAAHSLRAPSPQSPTPAPFPQCSPLSRLANLQRSASPSGDLLSSRLERRSGRATRDTSIAFGLPHAPGNRKSHHYDVSYEDGDSNAAKPTDEDTRCIPFLVWLPVISQNLVTYHENEPPLGIIYCQPSTEESDGSLAVFELVNSCGVDDSKCLFTVHGINNSELINMTYEAKLAAAIHHFDSGGRALAYGHEDMPTTI
ncbi:hypothetical protein C8T65DRAFT_738627 [Cerioporus squamosus]|nr:hypothetical protein C8T65DRAFT_738627 [Cerioporus squamosus]